VTEATNTAAVAAADQAITAGTESLVSIDVQIAQLEEVRKRMQLEFVLRMNEKLEALGFKLASLKATRGNGAARAPRKPAGPPKFRNPHSGEGWSGKGRPPAWILALEAQGIKREQFAVPGGLPASCSTVTVAS
jgi:DNA-binding protein H-NS